MISTSHYVDCEYKSGVGIKSGVVFAKALDTLHVAFGGRFAISFPEMAKADFSVLDKPMPPRLGARMCVFSDEATLAEIAAHAGIKSLKDYLHVSRVRTVRGAVKHCIWKRERLAVSTAATRARIVRRAKKRAEARGETVDFDTDGRYVIPKSDKTLPYLMMESRSNGNRFALTFDRIIVDTAVDGVFDSYGFSLGGATAPDIA